MLRRQYWNKRTRADDAWFRAMRVEQLEARTMLAAEAMITEFMARNDTVLVDGDGAASDWIELHNPGDEPIDLAGWHLTDSPTRATRWTFPMMRPELTLLAPGEYKLVIASRQRFDEVGAIIEPFVDTAGYLHVNFALSAGGEYLALIRPSGEIVSQFGTATQDFPAQYRDISYGIELERPGQAWYFLHPTPGEPNGNGVSGIVQDEVQFSRPSDSFFEPFDLALTTNAVTGAIHYTLDGSIPDASSSVYISPITVSRTTDVRARILREGFGPGPLTSESYVHLSMDVASFRSPLPIVILENFAAGNIPNKRAHNPPAGDGGNIRQVARQSAILQLFDRSDSGQSMLASGPDFTTRAGVRVRGSSSATFRKQSLSVESWNAVEEDERDIAPLGMPAESDWILYAPSPEFDHTLLHNSFIYELSQQIGRYAVRFQFVEVFLNTDGGSISMADHAGVYLWMEDVKRGEARVDIEPLSQEGTQGGWLLQSNRMQPIPVGGTEHPPNFHTAGPNRRKQGPYGRTFTGGTDRGGDDIPTGYNTFLNFESPNGRDINPTQIDAITAWFDEFEDALYAEHFTDAELGYRAYLDVDSFIDHALLTNLALSFDALQLSTYLYRRSTNAKLELGPVWDFDRAYGADSRAADPTTNLTYTQQFMWFPRLMQDPDFAQAYQDRWQELRAGPFATANLHAIIDRQAAEITEPVAAANGTRNWTTRLQAMKDWLAARAEAIDELYVDAPRFDLERERALPGAPVHIFASAGTIYYAPDGTDPRRSGGEVAEHAIELPAGNSMETVLVEANARAAAIVPSAEFHDQHGMTWTSHTTNFDDSPNAGWKHGTMGIGFDENDTYLPLLGLDLSQEMSNVNGTFYARIPFTVDGDDSSFDFLQLRMRYDDGFIAYVNGTEVLRVNAPVNATWDSVATLANRDSDAVEFQRFDVTPFASVLRPGTNLLAIHGLNRRATDNDLLIQAELVGGKYGRATLTPGITPRVVARALLDGQWSAAAAIVVAQPGDANGDGVFDSADLVQVFQAGRYEASPAQPVTFAEGDWNLDGRFSSRDLVMAFQAGSFQLAPASGSKRFAIDAVLDIAIETITSEVDAARHLRQA